MIGAKILGSVCYRIVHSNSDITRIGHCTINELQTLQFFNDDTVSCQCTVSRSFGLLEPEAVVLRNVGWIFVSLCVGFLLYITPTTRLAGSSISFQISNRFVAPLSEVPTANFIFFTSINKSCCGIVLVSQRYFYIIHLSVTCNSQYKVGRVTSPFSLRSSFAVESIVLIPLAIVDDSSGDSLTLGCNNRHCTTIHTELRTLIGAPVAVSSSTGVWCNRHNDTVDGVHLVDCNVTGSVTAG